MIRLLSQLILIMYQDKRQDKTKKVKVIAREYYRTIAKVKIEQSHIKIQSLYSLSNDVYKVSDGEGNEILIKMYNRSMPQFADNNLEAKLVYIISEQRHYPQVLYESEHYRIQRFVKSTAYSPKTLPNHLTIKIVEVLAQISCEYKQFVLEYNIDNQVRRRYDFNMLRQIFRSIYQRKMDDCPQLIKTCQESINKVFGNQLIMGRLTKILSQTEWVFSHNDLHLGNILIEPNQNILLLDFEFAQFNYLGFDIGNYFNQWATQYGETTFQIREEKEMSQELKDEVIRSYFGSLRRGYAFKDSKNDHLIYVQVGRVLSHLFWMIIGVKQIKDKRIGFNMVYYIKRRAQEFLKHYEILKEMLHF